jgi:uncharacterized circularly permuted ATP-grasp superfamily protein
MPKTPSKRTDNGAGPSGLAVISLQKGDSLLALANGRQVKNVWILRGLVSVPLGIP